MFSFDDLSIVKSGVLKSPEQLTALALNVHTAVGGQLQGSGLVSCTHMALEAKPGCQRESWAPVVGKRRRC